MRHFLIFLYAAATLAAANPSFHSPQSYYAGEPLFVGSGDLNGDGKPDMVVVNVGGPLQTLLNNGDGTFSPSATISITTPIAFAIGDFNGDGKLDVAIMSEDPVQSVNVYLGDGHGGFTTSKQTSFGMMPTSMAAGDVNGDGILDVVLYDAKSGDWTIGVCNGVSLTWSAAGNTSSLGNPLGPTGLTWLGEFATKAMAAPLFYDSKSNNWLMATSNGTAFTWAIAGNTSGFGDLAN